MQDFVIGQRWISAAELQLGLGMVIEIEHRTVSIVFPATGETRIYARADAPLTRVRWRHTEDYRARRNQCPDCLPLRR